jgi:protein TonB
MSYAERRKSSPGRLAGLGGVVILHAAAIYALATGLGHQAVEFLRAPMETRIVAELKPPEPPKVEPPPPQPPKVVKPPPPSYTPPPKVRVQAPPPVAAITATTEVAPTAPAPPPVTAPAPVVAPAVKVAPALDQARYCPPPQYPPAARRAGESGAVVLRFLIEVDGSVVDSLVDSSSGFERLDEAARAALAACRFKPGTVDGRPERSWARIRYVWKLQ